MMAAAGGTPSPRPDQQWRTPPPATVAPGGAAGTFRGRLVIVYGTGPYSGVFVYSPSPGLGNLIASITAATGTDPYGNPYQSGVCSYLTTTCTQISENGISWYTYDSVNSVWDSQGSIGYLNSELGISFETNSYMTFAEPISAVDPANIALRETWHPLTLGSGWAAASGYQTPSYRKNALGNVELTGRITGTSKAASAEPFALPAGYYSTTYLLTAKVAASSTAGANPGDPYLFMNTVGTVRIEEIPTTAGTVTIDLATTFMLSAG